MLKIRTRHIQSCAVVCAMGIIATSQAAAADPQDRFEPYNRSMFNFNKGVDKVVLTPVATGYQIVIPDLARQGIHNAFMNVDSIPIVINDFLQAKGNRGTRDLWRLFFNTTFGCFGLFDIATPMGIPREENDFGLTLATWGYKNSNYFIIPILGPSTVRDTIGLGVDYEFLTIYPYIDDDEVRYSLVILDLIQRRADAFQYQKLIDQASLDPYVFQRNAYMQKRDYKINRGEDSNTDTAHETNANDKDPYAAY